MRHLLLLAFPPLTACGPTAAWIEGTWTIDTWSATVTSGGTPLLDEAREDAGTIRFEGDGEMWTSIAYAEVPDVIGGASDLRVVDRISWVYWAFEHPEGVSEFAPPSLAIAWNQAYGETKLWELTDREADRFTATNTITYTLWPAPDGEITVRWQASRVEGER